MKASALLSLLFTSLLALEWHEDFKSAYALAKKEHKPLFLFIERVNPPCHLCENMKKRTLTNPKIAAFIQKHFILLKIDKYSGNYPQELYPKYVPTIYVIDPQKEKVLKRIVGFWHPKEFQSDLDDVKRMIKK